MKSCKDLFIFILCLLFLLVLMSMMGSCRRNQPSLIDTNIAPDTELWYAPPESTEYDYQVHLYWRGVDVDGTVTRFIWAITDTIVRGEDRWNPAQRLDDYRRGHITTKTDSVFSFTAFRNIGGVGLKKNRQGFHVAGIDDNGVIDPFPAEVEFIATIEFLPEIRFSTRIDSFYMGQRFPKDFKPYNPSFLDTAGMYRPFDISYHGLTKNGFITAYQWFPITNIELPGANIWTEDLTDTLRSFQDLENFNGVFRLAAQCADNANAESPYDPGTFNRGVCQVVVNFDPDTEIYDVINIYKANDVIDTVHVDFTDDIPDTVPFRSWVTLFYRGWDSSRDSILCDDDVNRCMKYQIRYLYTSERFYEVNFDSGLLPSEGPQDTNPCGISDSTSLNMGTVEYVIRVSSVDENGRVDGIPEFGRTPDNPTTAVIELVGNYDPTMDDYWIEDHLDRRLADYDTLKWRWDDVDHVLVQDDTSAVGFHYETTFTFNIRATGHDHPRELDGSGVKTWFYNFVSIDPPGLVKKFGRAGSWVAGNVVNQLNDVASITFAHGLLDMEGKAIFAKPPYWIGVQEGATNYAVLQQMTLLGRDTGLNEQFTESIFLRNFNISEENFVCPYLDPNNPISQRKVQNSYSTSRYGRWTEENAVRFYFQLTR